MRVPLPSRLLAPALALLLGGMAAHAKAQAPPPAPGPSFQGRDQVLLGRLYWKEGGHTQPLARFGAVLSGKSVSQPVTVAEGPAGGLTAMFTARRDGDRGARVSWSVQPGAGARVGAGEGRLEIAEGSVGHAAMGGGDAGELFASLETGRVSTFNVHRLWEHFGIVTDAQRFGRQAPVMPAGQSPGWVAGQTPGWAPAAPAAAAASAAPAPRRTSFTLSCPGGRSFDLTQGSQAGGCDLELDGDRIVGGHCDDGDGNSARASCRLDGGLGACVSSSGRGECRTR